MGLNPTVQDQVSLGEIALSTAAALVRASASRTMSSAMVSASVVLDVPISVK